MAKNLKHKKLHADATNISGNASHPRSQSPDSDQKPVAIPINIKKGGAPTTRKSTGPRTVQGQERSKFNALKHGLFSQAVLLEGESRGEFLSLLDGLLEDLRPQGKLETTLVENVAVLFWRKRRLFQAESAEISEKIEFVAYESFWNQYVEAWDRSRAAITSGGLLKFSDNPIVIHEAIAILGAVRAIVIKLGFPGYSPLLRKLYGQDQDSRIPQGLCLPYEIFASLANSRAKSKDKPEETSNDIDRMVELIDHEIERLKDLEEKLNKVDQKKIQYKSCTALIPGQEASDRLLRYETHFSREIDRILNRLERLQRLRLGQSVPPRVDININR